MPFAKGASGNPSGRPKGAQNKATLEIKEAARQFLADEIGQQKMLEQYQRGELNPSIVTLLHYYAYGKPKETMALEGSLPPFEVIFKDDASDE